MALKWRVLGLLGLLALPFGRDAEAAGAVESVFYNENGAAVTQGAAVAPSFTLSEPMKIPLVRVYHYNGGRPPAPGFITILNGSGQQIGSWKATACTPYHWCVQPNLVFNAGTYTVNVSSPATWSHNAQTGGKGFLLVHGIKLDLNAKGFVRSIFTQEAAAQDVKGPVRPMFFHPQGTDSMGVRWVARRTTVKVGEELIIEVSGSPATEMMMVVPPIYGLYRVGDDKNPTQLSKLAIRTLPSGTRTNADGSTMPEVRFQLPFRALKPGVGAIDIMEPAPGGTFKLVMSVPYTIQ